MKAVEARLCRCAHCAALSALVHLSVHNHAFDEPLPAVAAALAAALPVLRKLGVSPAPFNSEVPDRSALTAAAAGSADAWPEAVAAVLRGAWGVPVCRARDGEFMRAGVAEAAEVARLLEGCALEEL
jgi:hypothetical protein